MSAAIFYFVLAICGAAVCADSSTLETVNGKDPVHDAISVAKCRLRCLDEFLGKENGDRVDEQTCEDNVDCASCWKVCDYLQKDFKTWGEMCIFPLKICYDGCIQACLYHLDQSLSVRYTATPVIDGYAFPGNPSVTGRQVLWERVVETEKAPSRRNSAERNRKTIYSVLVSPKDGEWILLGQTLRNKLNIESNENLNNGRLKVMVVAVMKEGVVAVGRVSFIYSSSDRVAEETGVDFADAEPKLRPNGLPWSIPMASEIGTVMDGPPPGYDASRSAGFSGVVSPGGPGVLFDPQSSLPTRHEAHSVPTTPWNWNLVPKSVTMNPVTRSIDAVITWNPKPSQQGEYMITWEVIKENYGVKGHLYTRNSTITLFLAPEEVYRVQVEYISRALQMSEASPVIHVDTRNITSPTFWTQDMAKQAPSSFFKNKFEVTIMILVGFCALVLSFIFAIILRMKRKQLQRNFRADCRDGRDSTATLENVTHEFDRAKASLLNDRIRHSTPITVSTATSPFPFEDPLFPRVFRFPSVPKITKADPSCNEVLLGKSPKTKDVEADVVLGAQALNMNQSMPNISPDSLETHLTRFKNNFPSSRASVAFDVAFEASAPISPLMKLKFPPISKRKISNTTENVNACTRTTAFTSLQAINEMRELR
ncbi:unnamed protein product [Notodromas monacha]|uniref:Uncharacterized protein n=1 Tax=Notodromas monacha TaxID=399045 RepID=A0A7R9BGJ1_9CRUS|nr:unnamed protein product [Notodromas monacha]CAG0915073.1 unnamed protein product [Notodromas monacha]